MNKEIYGWHIVHAETGLPYAFCLAQIGDTKLTEEDVLAELDKGLRLIPVVRADEVH